GPGRARGRRGVGADRLARAALRVQLGAQPGAEGVPPREQPRDGVARDLRRRVPRRRLEHRLLVRLRPAGPGQVRRGLAALDLRAALLRPRRGREVLMATPGGARPPAPRALVVDDDETARLLLIAALVRAGFVCEEARDGLEALGWAVASAF